MALVGNTNAQKVWNFCIAKGLTQHGAAGLIGNIDAESALISTNLQDSCQDRLCCNDETYTALVDSGVYTKEQFIYDQAGYGLCQWTYWTRKKSLYEHARNTSRSIGDLEMQLEFLFIELQKSFSKVLNVLKSTTSVKEASDIVLMEFECPYDAESKKDRRASFGQKYYTQFATNSMKGVVTMGYKYYTKGQAVKVSDHFYSTEFDCHGSGCCSQTVVNDKLPVHLEMIRNHFKVPVTITSPYRCQTHNSRVGGAVGSRHSKGDACDIVVKGVPPRTVAQYCESIGILGIGLYETQSDGYFVHIDERDYKSFWYGQSEQPRTTFGSYNGVAGTNTSNTSSLDTILNIGDCGAAVKTLQENLIRLGYSCGSLGADGSFGNDTYQAVRKFQKAVGIGVDGIAGANTLNAIDKAIKNLDDKNASGKLIGSTVSVTASLLNVRSGAGTNNRIVKQVKYGTTFVVLEESNGWCKIDSPSGWVSKDYIKKV
jgi:hypothetical protein